MFMLKYMYIYIHIHACTHFIHTCDNTYIPYLLETKVVSKQCEEFHLLSMCSLFVGYYPNGMAQYDGTCLPLLRHKLADPAFHSHSLRCVHSDERNRWIMMNLMSPAECPAAFALLSFGYNWNLATQCELATVALTSLTVYILSPSLIQNLELTLAGWTIQFQAGQPKCPELPVTHVPRYMYGRLPERSYEVDTVLQDGRVLTALFPIAACGSLGKCGRPMMDLCCHTKKPCLCAYVWCR